ncbi:hypothetical protein EV424DRAFT_1571286 [Suillus variegatus]|nr:hypothetical protein EV424DRAFT_1571286 [Suillus variegatus]
MNIESAEVPGIGNRGLQRKFSPPMVLSHGDTFSLHIQSTKKINIVVDLAANTTSETGRLNSLSHPAKALSFGLPLLKYFGSVLVPFLRLTLPRFRILVIGKASVDNVLLIETQRKLQSLVDCKIARDTDAGHIQFNAYVTSKTVSHLNNAVQHFQLVLDQCPVSHPDHAMALTNLAWARLLGYIRNDLEDIDAITSLFHDALALLPHHHPDHPLSLYNLTEALAWHHIKKSTAADIREAAQLYHELLPLCPEDTYLSNIAAGNGITYVIDACNDLPTDASDEGIHLRRVVLELCPLGHQLRSRALNELDHRCCRVDQSARQYR